MAEPPGIEHAEVYGFRPALGWTTDLERAVHTPINARLHPVGP